MENLIIHSHTLFDDQSDIAPYPPTPTLPPASLVEAPSFDRSSTYTGSSEYDSKISIGDDFTPLLPSRPSPSIHPSVRGSSGSTKGVSNPSATRSEAEPNSTSPITFIQAPPLPFHPGGQGDLTPIQNFRGMGGLDFPQHKITDGDQTGSAHLPPSLSEPPSPHSSTLESPQPPPPPLPYALPQSTFTQRQHQQHDARAQRRPPLAQTMARERSQPKNRVLPRPPPPLPVIERTAAGDFELVAGPLDTSSGSTVEDGSLRKLHHV